MDLNRVYARIRERRIKEREGVYKWTYQTVDKNGMVITVDMDIRKPEEEPDETA